MTQKPENDIEACKATMLIAYTNMINVGLAAGFSLPTTRSAALALDVDAMASDDPQFSINEAIALAMRET